MELISSLTIKLYFISIVMQPSGIHLFMPQGGLMFFLSSTFGQLI